MNEGKGHEGKGEEGTFGFVIMLTEVWEGKGSSESVLTARIPSSSSFFCVNGDEHQGKVDILGNAQDGRE